MSTALFVHTELFKIAIYGSFNFNRHFCHFNVQVQFKIIYFATCFFVHAHNDYCEHHIFSVIRTI